MLRCEPHRPSWSVCSTTVPFGGSSSKDLADDEDTASGVSRGGVSSNYEPQRTNSTAQPSLSGGRPSEASDIPKLRANQAIRNAHMGDETDSVVEAGGVVETCTRVGIEICFVSIFAKRRLVVPRSLIAGKGNVGRPAFQVLLATFATES